MSVDATRWAWTVDVAKSTERLVLLSLADRASEDNACYPSMERVTKDTMLDIKTVKKVITDLIAKGLIEDTGERKGLTQKVRVLRLIGVDSREPKRTQKRNDSKNGMIPNFPSNEPKNGFLNEPKNGTLNEPKIGTQNLKENLTRNLKGNLTSSEPCRDVAIADTATDISTKVETTKKPKLTPEETEANKATWTAYATAYKNRYGVEPLRNAQVNGIVSKFVKAVSQEDAPSIARFFINISNQFYVQKLHDIKIMLADAGAIRTQWLTNRTVTTSQARQADTVQAAKSSVDGVVERRAKRQAEAQAMANVINGECTHV